MSDTWAQVFAHLSFDTQYSCTHLQSCACATWATTKVSSKETGLHASTHVVLVQLLLWLLLWRKRCATECCCAYLCSGASVRDF